MKEEYVQETLRDLGGNISKLSRVLGIDYVEARERYAPRVALGLPARPTTPPPADIRLLGRRDIRRYVIAVKEHVQEWPLEYRTALADARRKVDAGTHIMCQGRHPDGWTIQYLIPRKHPKAPRA